MRSRLVVPMLAAALVLAGPAPADAAPTAAAAPAAPATGVTTSTALGLGAGPAGAAAAAATRMEAAVSRSLTSRARSPYLGSHLSGLVVDRTTGRTVWSSRSGTTRMPASTQKVLTAHTVLRSTPASTRLVTRSLQSTARPGHVYLRGGGDPSLTSARLQALARSTSVRLKAQGRRSVDLYVDDTVFPAATAATGWKSSYLTGGEVQRVRGLTLAGYHGADGALAAGARFRTHLTAAGITVRSIGRGTAPAARAQLAASSSSTVGAMTRHMLNASDNTYAEYLLRVAALEAGLRPTWTNARAHQRAILTRDAIPQAGYLAYDGSGLSRSNRMPVRTLTATIARIHRTPAERAVVFAADGMPRAGRTGTLRSRYATAATRCARDRVVAKTGTLGDVVALAGVARGVDGRDRIFAFLENGRSETSAARGAVDGLATATVGCRL